MTGLLCKDGKKADTAALSYAGETSLFAGDMATPRPLHIPLRNRGGPRGFTSR